MEPVERLNGEVTILPLKKRSQKRPCTEEKKIHTSSRSSSYPDVFELNARYESRATQEVLVAVLRERILGRVALVSSFGAESAVLLHLVAQIAPDTPVIFIETGKLFGETHRYRDLLLASFGLTNLRIERPDPEDLQKRDPKGGLWTQDTNACCYIRRVKPLRRALEGIDAWITGRKRFQARTRAHLPLFEKDGPRIKVNPLITWGPEDLAAYAKHHALPAHPLVAQGFLSIGCMPCTDRVQPGEDPRAGRWRGSEKVECGIHLRRHGTETDGSGI